MISSKYFIPALLVLAVSASTAPAGPERTERLARECLKTVRLEQRAQAGGGPLEEGLRAADSLLVLAARSLDPGCVRRYVQTGEGPCREPVEAFLQASGSLRAPLTDSDPAAAVASVLRGTPGCGELSGALLEGYGAAFQVVLEGRRELGLRLDLVSFLMAAGCPATLQDLGLSREDTLGLKALAAEAAARTAGQGYGTGPSDFYITMVRLDDIGGRFGRQQDENTLTGRLTGREEIKEMLPRLQGLKPMTVGFLGDSQMDNRHWSSAAHFPNIIAEVFRRVNPAVTVFNAGVGGDDSGEGLARLDRQVLAREPDICFVMFGGNDCAHWGGPEPSVSPGQYRRNLAEIAGRLEKASCRPVLMSYPQIPEFTEADHRALSRMNGHLAAIRDSLSTGWLDTGTLIDRGDPRRLFAVDGIHLSPEAHLMVAGKVLEYLGRLDRRE
ncbi:MAG: SGNH/GDSL hydrolase family protein [Candidatus Glassbacteria bacterium]|nr:SGNH/GDSL hydrolase family protein [Candidatus Glassbacteria bacterium]